MSAADGGWMYDRKRRRHRLDGAVIEKQGDVYLVTVLESPSTFVAEAATLAEAKRLGWNRVCRPAPARFRCHWCDAEIVCAVNWTGTSWSQMLPGAIEMTVCGGGFRLIQVCDACVSARKEASHAV